MTSMFPVDGFRPGPSGNQFQNEPNEVIANLATATRAAVHANATMYPWAEQQQNPP